MKLKKVLFLASAALAAVAVAMPTAEKLAEAQGLVDELMAPELKALRAKDKTSAEVGEAACKLAEEAEGEAAKWLLLSDALRYFVRAGAGERAVATLKTMQGAVKDVPDAAVLKLLGEAVKLAPKGTEAPLNAVGREVQGRVRAAEALAKAEAALKKTPKDPALHRRVGDCHAVLGDWDAALRAYRRADAKIAAAAKAELQQAWPLEKLGDFWWDEAEKARGFSVKAALFRQAVARYQDAVGSGALTGLLKTRAERRIAEVAEKYPASGLFTSEVLYLVVDLSAGPDAKQYPVSSLMAAPARGWTDEYKTTKLVLRRIEPGSYIMGDDQKDESHRVTITQPFYIGVFPVTQKQWALVKGPHESFWKGKCAATRPVECVSYNNDIRGQDKGLQWPASNDVDDDSFLGRLRARTQRVFDLPTEGQWEYACRAGTTGDHNAEGGMDKLGRYFNNGGWNEAAWGKLDWGTVWNQADRDCGPAYGTAPVGTYKPNAWGIYDCHGNVFEWCLDRGAKRSTYGTDPKGAASGGSRVLRGGCWDCNARTCRSAHRVYWNSSLNGVSWGFRLACSAGPRK